ncbi:MAG: ABC transporter permease [Chloroflexi bacterium]|nr:ABC transporter permease [Chloroflexota bacterium]
MTIASRVSFGRIGAERRAQRRTGVWYDAFRRLRKNRLALAATGLTLALLLAALFAPIVAPYPYDEPHFDSTWVFPFTDSRFILGTDGLGRDMLSRLIYGGRVSLAVGIGAELLCVLIGIPLGALAGLRGGKTDYVICRVIDLFSSLPYIVVVILMLAVLGPGLVNIFIAIGLAAWVAPCRLMRGQVLSVKETPYVRAAVSMGAGQRQLITRHLIPNSISPVIVGATLGVPTMIFAEAGLSFLGLGVRPPTPSWGLMLGESFQFARGYYYMVLFPAIMVALTMLGFTLMGDGLRDALDPRMND